MTSSFGANAVCPICEKSYFKDQPWKRVCLTCYIENKKSTAPQTALATPQIEPSMLRRLIQLAHPDRHGNSEAANTATRYLLGLRGAP